MFEFIIFAVTSGLAGVGLSQLTGLPNWAGIMITASTMLTVGAVRYIAEEL